MNSKIEMYNRATTYQQLGGTRDTIVSIHNLTSKYLNDNPAPTSVQGSAPTSVQGSAPTSVQGSAPAAQGSALSKVNGLTSSTQVDNKFNMLNCKTYRTECLATKDCTLASAAKPKATAKDTAAAKELCITKCITNRFGKNAVCPA